jgi:sugar-specific transcriptional regulator TrmB
MQEEHTQLGGNALKDRSIRSTLERLGLDDREVEVYLALLHLKIGRVTTIAKAAKQPRTLTYVILDKLKERGIVSETMKGKMQNFVAESPQRLLSYLKDQRNELNEIETLLEDAIPHLECLTSPLAGTPRVTMLHGEQGMKQIYRDVLQHEFVGLFNTEAMYNSFGENLVTKIYGKNVKLRGRDLLVDNPGARKFINEVQQHAGYEIRLIPEATQFATDTIVFGDTIALFSYDDEKSIVRIENHNLANTFRSWFDIIWEQSTKTTSSK